MFVAPARQKHDGFIGKRAQSCHCTLRRSGDAVVVPSHAFALAHQFQAVFQLAIVYNASQEAISDRISDDAERLYLALDTLDTSVPGLERVDIDPTGVVDDGAEIIQSAFNIAATYRLAASVVTG